MVLTKVNQENEGVSVGTPNKKGAKLSSGKSSKSLIPVPRTSNSPKNDENASPAYLLGQKARRPLAAMQHSESPQRRLSVGKSVVKKIENEGTPVKVSNANEKMVGTEAETAGLPASVQLHRNFPGTPQNSPNKMKSRKSSIVGTNKGLKTRTEESESIAYWKELAEARRQALDAALQENYELHKRVEELEQENAHLDEIVNEAKKLAIMVNDAAEEVELSLDESGIVEATEDVGTAV